MEGLKGPDTTRSQTPGRRRSIAQRSLEENILKEVIDFEQKGYVRPTLYLGRRAFVAWWVRGELWGRVEAEQRWRDAFEDKRG